MGRHTRTDISLGLDKVMYKDPAAVREHTGPAVALEQRCHGGSVGVPGKHEWNTGSPVRGPVCWWMRTEARRRPGPQPERRVDQAHLRMNFFPLSFFLLSFFPLSFFPLHIHFLC